MDCSFGELKKKTVAELREIASGIEHDAVKGYTQLNKEHLLKALCNALEIDMHQHHQVVGLDKSAIKLKIRELKKARDEAINAHDYGTLKAARRKIHRMKRKLHQAMV